MMHSLKAFTLAILVASFSFTAMAESKAEFISFAHEQIQKSNERIDKLKLKIQSSILRMVEVDPHTNKMSDAILRRNDKKISQFRIDMLKYTQQITFWDRILFEVERDNNSENNKNARSLIKQKVLDIASIETLSNDLNRKNWRVFINAYRDLQYNCNLKRSTSSCLIAFLNKASMTAAKATIQLGKGKKVSPKVKPAKVDAILKGFSVSKTKSSDSIIR